MAKHLEPSYLDKLPEEIWILILQNITKRKDCSSVRLACKMFSLLGWKWNVRKELTASYPTDDTNLLDSSLTQEFIQIHWHLYGKIEIWANYLDDPLAIELSQKVHNFQELVITEINFEPDLDKYKEWAEASTTPHSVVIGNFTMDFYQENFSKAKNIYIHTYNLSKIEGKFLDFIRKFSARIVGIYIEICSFKIIGDKNFDLLLVEIKKLNNLKSLTINDINHKEALLREKSVVSLLEALEAEDSKVNLKELSLGSFCNISYLALDKLSKFSRNKELEILKISSGYNSNAGQEISKHEQSIDLFYNSLSTNYPSLKRLIMVDYSIVDANLIVLAKALANHKNIQELEIKGKINNGNNIIDNTGVASLIASTRVKRLLYMTTISGVISLMPIKDAIAKNSTLEYINLDLTHVTGDLSDEVTELAEACAGKDITINFKDNKYNALFKTKKLECEQEVKNPLKKHKIEPIKQEFCLVV